MKKYIYILIAVIILVGIYFIFRSHNAIKGSEVNMDSVKIDLSDNVFMLRNIKSTLELKNLYWDEDDAYSNKYKGHKFTKLDSLQKLKFIAPFMKDVGPEWVSSNMRAYLLAKQNKIGDLTPIIINLEGDDYNSIMLILIDSNNKPVSNLVLTGGESAGPLDETDSTVTYNSDQNAYLHGNEITSYTVVVCQSTDTIPKPSIIDSMTYHSFIKSTGEIVTQRIESVRSKRIIENLADDD